MPAVQRLPEALVNQIAAGEVVERPASVVKELVENALDAGARRIAIEVEGGGVALVQVSDDGCGMPAEDALLALERHATSKVRSLEDLARIGTLGFRGEALPSIASVSRLSLVTSPDDSGLGTEVVGDRGAPAVARPARQTKGTRVLVEDLFGNVPARRKFLKSPDAELRAIVRTVTALALARPDVAFSLRSAGRTHLDVAAAKDERERFIDVLGSTRAEGVLAISRSGAGFAVSGAVTPPAVSFPSRAYQWLFLNRRPIRDNSASHAASLAAREALGEGRHPAFALFLSCDPALADVNVHPQKLEVRFKDPGVVHSLVHRTLAAALGAAKGAAPLTGESLQALAGFAPPSGAWRSRPAFAFESGPGMSGVSAIAEAIGVYGGAARPLAEPAGVDVAAAYGPAQAAASPLGPIRLLGQYRESYLLAEGAGGLVLVDQHAAHERVRYERILRSLAERPAASQPFLLPVTFEASADEAEALRGAEPLLAYAGFMISELSGRTFLVSAAPADLPAAAVSAFLSDFLARAADEPGAGNEAATRRRERLAASLACRGAVTVNTRLAPAEAVRLLSDLAGCEDPFSCPHGRPVLLELGHGELEKRFGRR